MKTIQGYSDHLALKSISRITLTLLLAGAFTTPLSDWHLIQGYLSLGDAFFLSAFIYHFSTAAVRQFLGIPYLLFLAAFLFLFSGIVTYAIGGRYSEPQNALKLAYALSIFPFALAAVLQHGEKTTERFLLAWAVGAALSACVALAGQHGISLFGLYNYSANFGNRVTGMAYHPNAFSYSLSLCFLALVYLGIGKPKTTQIALAALGILFINGMSDSGSRASLAALGIALVLVSLLLTPPRRLIMAFMVLLGFSCLALISYSIITQFDVQVIPKDFSETALGRLLGFSETARFSNSERERYISLTWEMFLSAPFLGNGYGWLRGPHVQVLAIMLCGGLFGLFALVIWAWGIFNSAYRIALNSHALTLSEHRLFTICVGGIVIWFITGALHPLLMDRNGYLFFGILLALEMKARARILLSNQQYSPARETT